MPWSSSSIIIICSINLNLVDFFYDLFIGWWKLSRNQLTGPPRACCRRWGKSQSWRWGSWKPRGRPQRLSCHNGDHWEKGPQPAPRFQFCKARLQRTSTSSVLMMMFYPSQLGTWLKTRLAQRWFWILFSSPQKQNQQRNEQFNQRPPGSPL